MATYKVIQDIEAEDKLLGPLSLRQFIYAVIAIGGAFIAVQLAIATKWYLALPFMPPIALFGVLAAPFGHDQSPEVWLLAKIRFVLKPHLRIWDQNGIKELVTITVPKNIDHQLTNNLSPNEVSSRLQALANTLDSRGWAIKNVNVNLYSEPSYVNQQTSDRLVDMSTLPQDVPSVGVAAADDILDAQSNPTAHHFEQMIAEAEKAHHERIVTSVQDPNKALRDAAAAPQQWFVGAPPAADPSADEQAMAAKLKASHDTPDPTYAHMHALQPLNDQNSPSAPVTTPVDPAILNLANNDDLNVATIARQANKVRKQPPEDEVVISLR